MSVSEDSGYNARIPNCITCKIEDSQKERSWWQAKRTAVSLDGYQAPKVSSSHHFPVFWSTLLSNWSNLKRKCHSHNSHKCTWKQKLASSLIKSKAWCQIQNACCPFQVFSWLCSHFTLSVVCHHKIVNSHQRWQLHQLLVFLQKFTEKVHLPSYKLLHSKENLQPL